MLPASLQRPSRAMNTLWSLLSSRRFQARTLSTILCAISVVVRPFSHFGGRSAFLAITIKELVFSAQENLPQQIEATFLHLVGGLTGISLSSFGKFLASLAYNRTGDSSLTRFIPGLTLTLICFLAGWLKSRLPRLTLASRIACFVSIWLLTFDVGSHQHIDEDAIGFIWIIGVSALSSLFSCMILLRWSSTQFAVELAKALSELQTCMRNSLEEHSADNSTTRTQTLRYIAPADLLKRSISLDALYQQASFDLRIGRVSVKSLKHLITTVEHLRRILSRRFTIPGPSSADEPEEDSAIRTFRKPALDLGGVILESMESIEFQILTCYNSSLSLIPATEKIVEITMLQSRLTEAVNVARGHLQRICDELDAKKQISSGHVQLPDSCTCAISLLQMAQELQLGLTIMRDIRACYDQSRLRLWHPRFSLAWLGVTPTMVSIDEGGAFLDDDTSESSNILSEPEALQGIAERTSIGDQDYDHIRRFTKKSKIIGSPLSPTWFKSLVHSTWNHPKTLKARLRLSRSLKSLERSPHFRHALKNGTGVALLGLPAFMAMDTSARQWFLSSFGQWMIISYVWVLETNTGATIRVGYLRLCGTILGAIYAYIASLFCKSNPYALVTMMTLAELPISWIIMKTTFSPMGTVAAVTLPPILFTQYFETQEQVATWRLALFRAATIAAGIIAALLANSFLFPRHCRVLFLHRVCQTLGSSNQLFMNISRDLFHHTQVSAVHKQRSYKLEREIRNLLHRLAVLLKTMDDEVSLVPKPMKRYRQILNGLHRLSDLLTSLRKVAQNIPKKEIMATVAPQRRELVSCVCIGLFASEQVFRARQPLPQFLPSSRLAFIGLEREVEEQLVQSYQGENESHGLSLIYMIAELDMLAELVDTIDELVELTRRLFGTSSWLNHHDGTPMQTSGMTSMQEGSMTNING